MKGKTFIIFIILISSSVILSFAIPKKIIDQIQMISVMGYDQVEEERIRGTTIVPKYVSKNKIQNIIYTDIADLIYENNTQLNSIASEELHNGKLEIVMYGKELAKKGLIPYIDFLTRDPSIGSRTHLAIVEESAFELMNSVKTDKSAGIYFSDLLEHNVQNGNLPSTNLKIFQTGIKSKLDDPFLPILKIKGEKAALEGIGFFDKGKFVYQLPYEEAFYFKVLTEEIGNGKYVMNHDNVKASIQSIHSTRKFKIKGSAENPVIQMNIDLRGVLREYSGPSLDKYKDEVSKMWKEEVEQRGGELVSKFQELGIDPINIGLFVKARKRGFDLAKWEEIYPNADIKIHVTSKVIETGTKN